MNQYAFPQRLQWFWNEAAVAYQNGVRDPLALVSESALAFLAANGLTPYDLFDGVEDFLSGGDPDFLSFLMISAVRRDYFQIVQKGVISTLQLDPDTLPAKTASVEGIEWLPRILPKARAKLRGELPPSIMFGCGGDRRFLKRCDLHPADFLRGFWARAEDEAATVAWIRSRLDHLEKA
jgi:hypothetical protein